VEEYVMKANWEPRDILGAAPNVEFENTNYLGRARKYSRMVVPHGGYIYPAFDLNHSYEDCDVFVSLAKMKEHATAESRSP
jgi:predicted class III extradiol MEMO1 family dioxygenase